MVEVLHARPPTPPRTSSRASTLDGEGNRMQGPQALLGTPGDSPASANGSTNPHSGRRSKRVNFSPWTNYIKPPTFAPSASKLKTDLKALAPSNERKPSKSILKTTNVVCPFGPLNSAPHSAESFAIMLESVTQQLAGESPSSRLDAYIHLLGALKAYEGLPGEQELAGRLGLIAQFIQRDICRDLENGGPLDINLVIHALKLCIALVWNSGLSEQLSDEFKTFIIDHSVNCLQAAKIPKSVLTHYMHVLSTQNFPTKVMTNARLTRILTVLHDITDRVSGNAVVSQRLNIYQRVLSQSKSTMATQSALWVEHLISGLLHHIKDTRLKAISLGVQTSTSLGPNSTLSNTILDIFDKPLDKGRKLVSEICERMSRMMSATDSGVHVPQVWSIIVLLLRSKRFSVDQWEHFKEWVLVLQKCFNCSEPAIKAQAILAWNRFVYVISPNESTSLSLIRMLSKPILSQFERRKHDKTGSQAGQLALSSYYNLLYYAFRPSVSHQHLDVVWEEYIAQPFASIFTATPGLSDRVCQLLACLLWSSQPKIWTENKVNETSKLNPEELPSLDCKWVRSRIASVLKVFESLFKSSLWVDDAIDKSNIGVAWVNLSKALSNASSKEVKPSTESMQAVASVLGLLQRVWVGGPRSLNVSSNRNVDTFFDRFRFLSTTIILSVGTISFTEKLLLKTPQETYQTANTPTHRQPHADTNLDTPILHLLRLIDSFPASPEPSRSYLRLIDSTLEAGSNGRLSRGSRLDLFRQCADLYPSASLSHPSTIPHFTRFIWQATAKFAEDCLRSFAIGSARDRDGSVSHDYDNVIKVLLSGLRFPDASPSWSQLLDAFVRVVRTERGEHAIAAIIVEPLAEQMMHLRLGEIYLPSAALLNHALSLPYYHPDKSHATSTEPVTSLSGPDLTDGVLFPHKLLQLVDKTLRQSYTVFNPAETGGVTDFIESLTSFLGSGILAFRSATLEILQVPLALWLRDEVRQFSSDRCADSKVLTACRALSLAIPNILQTSVTHDTSKLHKFKVVICSGLESSHKSTTNRFIELWNGTFGLQESLEYPESVIVALKKLEPFVELQLPCIPVSTDIQVRIKKSDSVFAANKSKTEQSDPDFTCSQEDDICLETQLKVNGGTRRRFSLGNQLRVPRPTSFSSSPIVRSNEPAANELSDKPINLTPRRRLRHDDSQVKFVPVGSSPSLRSDPETQILTERQKEVRERQHNETSLLLEGFRSSPGSRAVRDIDLDTPTHLCDLRNSELVAEIQLTPTIPMGLPENDDVFLGSSPTPGSKGRAQLDGSNVPSSLSIQALDNYGDLDPPSSPPEFDAPSAKVLERSGDSLEGLISERVDVRTDKETHRDPDQATAAPEDVQRTFGMRSENTSLKTADTSIHNSQKPQVRESVTTAQNITSTAAASTRTTRSTSKAEGVVSEALKGNNHIPTWKAANRNYSNPSASVELIPDSFSDDLELQVASQLEQDLELAVDLDDTTEGQLPRELPDRFPMTRKRKREVTESGTTPDRLKRRSLRNSSIVTRGAVKARSPETRTIRTRRSAAHEPAEETSVAATQSSAPSTSKKRKGQPKEAEAVITSYSQKRDLDPNDNGVDRSSPCRSISSDQSQKRRSRRLSGYAALPIPEADESPRKTSTRASRSHVQEAPRSQGRADVSEERRMQEEHEILDLSQGKYGHAAEDPWEQNEPTGHGDVTDTELEQPEEPRGQNAHNAEHKDAEADVQMKETEMGPLQEGSSSAMEMGRYVSRAVQTEDLPGLPIGAETSDSGILNSLRRVLGNIKLATFGRTALREIDDVMFDIRVETHEAARRHIG